MINRSDLQLLRCIQLNNAMALTDTMKEKDRDNRKTIARLTTGVPKVRRLQLGVSGLRFYTGTTIDYVQNATLLIRASRGLHRAFWSE